MRVTIKEIAKELGVSHSTVSRVLNDKHSALVSQSTRERIVQTAAQMGYRPSRIAQALQGESTRLIGVFLPREENYFYQEVLAHLRAAVEKSDYELLLFSASKAQIRATWSRLLQWDLDGIFVFDYLLYVEGLHEALRGHERDIPPVIGLFSSQTQLQDSVTVDFRAAMEGLLAHLHERGCRRVGYMAPVESFQALEQRYAVYCQFMQERGGETQKFVLPLDVNQREAAYHCLCDHLQAQRPLPDALFCQNDEQALGAYRALCQHGVAIPERVALAGCDNIPYISYLETPLTTFALPIEEICRQGWRLLQERMANPGKPPAKITLEAALVLRASTQKQETRGLRADGG